MWNYYWGYTAQQIQLLLLDAPIIVYKDKNKKDRKPSVLERMKGVDRFMNKYKDGDSKNKFDFGTLKGFQTKKQEE